MKTNLPVKRSITVERIYDLLVDIVLRHRRGSSDSITTIMMDHSLDGRLHIPLVNVGFLRKEGKKNVYTGMEHDMDLAIKVLDQYTSIGKQSEESSNVTVYDEDLGKRWTGLQLLFRICTKS